MRLTKAVARGGALLALLACPALSWAQPAPATTPPPLTFKSLGQPPLFKPYVAGSLTWNREGEERARRRRGRRALQGPRPADLRGLRRVGRGLRRRHRERGQRERRLGRRGAPLRHEPAALPERRGRLERAHGEGRLHPRLHALLPSRRPLPHRRQLPHRVDPGAGQLVQLRLPDPARAAHGEDAARAPRRQAAEAGVSRRDRLPRSRRRARRRSGSSATPGAGSSSTRTSSTTTTTRATSRRWRSSGPTWRRRSGSSRRRTPSTPRGARTPSSPGTTTRPSTPPSRARSGPRRAARWRTGRVRSCSTRCSCRTTGSSGDSRSPTRWPGSRRRAGSPSAGPSTPRRASIPRAGKRRSACSTRSRGCSSGPARS